MLFFIDGSLTTFCIITNWPNTFFSLCTGLGIDVFLIVFLPCFCISTLCIHLLGKFHSFYPRTAPFILIFKLKSKNSSENVLSVAVGPKALGSYADGHQLKCVGEKLCASPR